jgi:hypothetical protein
VPLFVTASFVPRGKPTPVSKVNVPAEVEPTYTPGATVTVSFSGVRPFHPAASAAVFMLKFCTLAVMLMFNSFTNDGLWAMLPNTIRSLRPARTG